MIYGLSLMMLPKSTSLSAVKGKSCGKPAVCRRQRAGSAPCSHPHIPLVAALQIRICCHKLARVFDRNSSVILLLMQKFGLAEIYSGIAEVQGKIFPRVCEPGVYVYMRRNRGVEGEN